MNIPKFMSDYYCAQDELQVEDSTSRRDRKLQFFCNLMVRLVEGELALSTEQAYKFTKKVYRKGHPVRDLPNLGDVYSMKRRELLHVLTECPESRLFTQKKPNLTDQEAMERVL